MQKFIIYNARIVNEGKVKTGHVLVEGSIIKDILNYVDKDNIPEGYDLIDATGLHLLPGVIDDQVHFREPGLTHKADIYTESMAAVAGGVTSFMEMPNTIPQSTTLELLEEKYQIAAEKSWANYSFYLGATNDNIEEIVKIDPKNICGLKVFMGSSTGNMLVDNIRALEDIFEKSPVLIATHCEDESTIKRNTLLYKEKYGEDVPIGCHPLIRSTEACYLSSSLAVNLAKKHHSRLHVLHISTARELELFEARPLNTDKKITNEVCVHHLWFDENDYSSRKTLIKWNPAVKSLHDKTRIREAVSTDLVDVIATDHAPHTLNEKQNSYFKAPSGGPMIQHSLVAMLELTNKNVLSLTDVVKKMCHNPAILFNIEKRGFIKPGYFADLVLVDTNSPWTAKHDNVFYKCKWTPMDGINFNSKVISTFVNGYRTFHNDKLSEEKKGMRLTFNR